MSVALNVAVFKLCNITPVSSLQFFKTKKLLCVQDNEHLEGILVNPNNLNAMVEAIISVKNNVELKNKIVLNARVKVEDFSWQVVKPKWQNLLS